MFSSKFKLALPTVVLAATLSLAGTSGAAITTSIVAGTTCAGAPTATFTPGAGSQDVTVCVNTTTEFVCGSTLQFVSTAPDANRFNLIARTVAAAFPDIAQGFVNPTPITAVASGDLGSNITTGANAVSPGSSIALGTFTIAPQATATNASYAISLGSGAVLATATSATGCGLADVPAIAASFTFVKAVAATNVTFTRTPATLTFAEGGAAQTIAVSCTGTIGTPTPVTLSVAGNNAAAFTVAPATLSFADCSAPQNVTVTPRAADAGFNATQTGNVTFTNTTAGGTVVAPPATAVTVTDNQSPAVYNVTKATATVTEGSATTDTLTVTCTGAFTGGATSGSVQYAITGLTNPGDIAAPPLTGALNFAACAGATQSITLSPRVNDSFVQGNKVGNFTISTPAAGGALGTTTTGTVNVVDDDTPQVVTVAVSGSPATEAGGVLTYTFTRAGGNAGAVAATLAVNITPPATSTRYSSTCASPITFAANATTATCTVTGIDNAVVDGNVNVVVAVAVPTVVGAYTVGTPASATGIIADNEIGISVTGTGTTEGGNVSFSITCTGPAASTATVTFAISGQDAGATITPAPGPVTVTCGTPTLVTVSSVDDAIIGNNRAVTLTLSAPVSPAVIIGAASVAAAVADNDQPKSVPTMGVFGLGLMSLMLAGFAALQRRRSIK